MNNFTYENDIDNVAEFFFDCDMDDSICEKIIGGVEELVTADTNNNSQTKLNVLKFSQMKEKNNNISSDEDVQCKSKFTKKIVRKIASDLDKGNFSPRNKDSQSVEILTSQTDNAISISSNEKQDSSILSTKKMTRQSKSNLMIKTGARDVDENPFFCTAAQYAQQSTKISILRTNLLRCKSISTTNLPLLAEKAALISERQTNLEELLPIEEERLKNMVVKYDAKESQKTTWDQLRTSFTYVVPNIFGKHAMNIFNTQKTLTMKRLKSLYDSLATCPDENTFADDPKELQVELMPHQKQALAWLMWREKQNPSGGILADDIGLGKTLTMISLILASKRIEIQENNSGNKLEEKSSELSGKNNKFKAEGGTLVICPGTVIRHWKEEIRNKVKRNLLSVELYPGNKQENYALCLAKYDVVITSYKLAQGEYQNGGPLYNVKWTRIILDEAHLIRNHTALASTAVCVLKATSRWLLTGAPVHNNELDLYALLKFLRCSPFDDIIIWRQWIANKNAGGQDRLNTLVTSILLRRTKVQLQTQGASKSLPEKKFQEIEVTLDSAEKHVYRKIYIFSRILFIEFLRQKAGRVSEYTNIKENELNKVNDKLYRKVIELYGNNDIKFYEILILLFRLRQICCHPSLIISMLDKEDCETEGIKKGISNLDVMEKLSNLNLNEDSDNLNTLTSKVLNSLNPILSDSRINAKLRTIQNIIEEKILPTNDKIIIVSQWNSMLNIIMRHLKQMKIECDILHSKVPVPKRNDIVQIFNSSKSGNKVLLLSLTAKGTGLNLIGANHLLFVDLHWNPQLELQAQDTIYHVGQKKTVYIYKIITEGTMEEKIKELRSKKLNMVGDLVSGVENIIDSKLSLDDLKFLFNVTG